MQWIREGTYRFNDVLTVPPTNYAAQFNFSIQSFVQSVSQEEADIINGEYGDGAITAGDYVICSTGVGIEARRTTINGEAHVVVYYMGFNAYSVPPNDLASLYFGSGYREFYTSHGYGWNVGTMPPPHVQIITVTSPQLIDDDFFRWFTENTKKLAATVTYNGQTIAELFEGETATLKCEGDAVKMLSDIDVKAID